MKHFRPVKALGQSFLTHEPTADRLVAALELGRDEDVIEIGAGKGILTRRLVALARSVTAIEIDPRLVEHLRQSLGHRENLRLVCADALEFDFNCCSATKVIGNLPYNAASQILFRLLHFRSHWRIGVFTLQREFAQRLVALPGSRDYGAITVQFELDTERKRLFNISNDCFKPRPDVVSTAVVFRWRQEPAARVTDRACFLRVVKAAFGQRRKTLANNLMSGLGLDRSSLRVVRATSCLDLRRRAETLSLAEFARLAEALCAVKV